MWKSSLVIAEYNIEDCEPVLFSRVSESRIKIKWVEVIPGKPTLAKYIEGLSNNTDFLKIE